MPALSNLIAVLGELGVEIVLGPKAKLEGRSGWIHGRARFAPRYPFARDEVSALGAIHVSVFVLDDRAGGWRVRNGAGAPAFVWLCAAALASLARGEVVDPERRLRASGSVAAILELAHASGAVRYSAVDAPDEEHPGSEADADDVERAVLEDAELRRTAREIGAPRRARTIS
jgi:hypothetical protein